MDADIKPDKIIDCTGLFCPMPIVSTKEEIKTISSGQILEISADDPGFEKDLPAWCNMTGNKLISIVKKGNLLIGYVRKK